MKPKTKIYFVHEGRAMYPLIRSMRECYADEFDIEECSFAEAEQKSDLKSSICWHMMGFYPKKLECALTIHDYRSLSLGRGGWFKDRVKETFCAKPDVRIIQPSIAKYLNFNDGVDTYLLDVAVSDFVLDYKYDPRGGFEQDFCYIGAMKAERKMEIVIDSFLDRFNDRKTFVLVGKADQYLIDRYDGVGGVKFRGVVTQRAAFEAVTASKVSVAYFPEHAPHKFQTPTKLLEYAVIGGKILANLQPMNVAKSKEYGIECVWRPSEDMFGGIDVDSPDWPANLNINRSPFLFKYHLKSSGLEALIGKFAASA